MASLPSSVTGSEVGPKLSYDTVRWIPEEEEVEVEISAFQSGVTTLAVVKGSVWNWGRGRGGNATLPNT